MTTISNVSGWIDVPSNPAGPPAMNFSETIDTRICEPTPVTLLNARIAREERTKAKWFGLEEGRRGPRLSCSYLINSRAVTGYWSSLRYFSMFKLRLQDTHSWHRNFFLRLYCAVIVLAVRLPAYLSSISWSRSTYCITIDILLAPCWRSPGR